MPGNRKEHFRQDPTKYIDWPDTGTQVHMATEADEQVIAFLHPKRQVSPVVVPARRDIARHTSTLCSSQKQQLSIQLQLGDSGVGADDSVDAGAGTVEGINIIVLLASDKGFQFLQLLGWQLRGVPCKSSYLVSSVNQAVDEVLANIAGCTCHEY